MLAASNMTLVLHTTRSWKYIYVARRLHLARSLCWLHLHSDSNFQRFESFEDFNPLTVPAHHHFTYLHTYLTRTRIILISSCWSLFNQPTGGTTTIAT